MKSAFRLLVVITVFSLALLNGCEEKQQRFRIGILQWTEVLQPYVQTHQGVLDSLNDKGYLEGLNIEFIYTNVEQDKALALTKARDFVTKKVDVIVALGTGSAQAALEATAESRIPIVFSIVGAPKATGLISEYDRPGRNITGVTMRVPVSEQLTTIHEILHEIETIGIIYCTEMVQAVATGDEAVKAAQQLGWNPRELALSSAELGELSQKVKEIVKELDAIYIPTDPIMSKPEHLEVIVGIADEEKIPVIGVAKHFLKSGILAAVHCDFYEIGRQAGEPIDQVLNGMEAGNIPVQLPIVKRMSLNLNKARELGIEIKRNTILKADNIFE